MPLSQETLETVSAVIDEAGERAEAIISEGLGSDPMTLNREIAAALVEVKAELRAMRLLLTDVADRR